MGRAGPPFEPCRRPQAGKSGYPHSQNADSSPRAQGAPGLGLAEKRRGKCEAPRALIACSLGCRVAVDWTWASLFLHATGHPRPQAVRARDALHLPFRLPAQPSPGAPWARGLLSAFWERGSPDLPACGLWRGSGRGPARPVFISSSSRPSRGAKPRGADDRKLPPRQPHQAGSRGGGEIKAGVPHEVLVTQAMTIETRRALACALSLFPLWCKGGKHRPRHQARVTIPVQRDQGQQSGRTEVTVEPKTASPLVPLAGEDHL